MPRFLTCGMLLICGMLTISCSPSIQAIREECEKSIKDYNRMLRWQEVESAGMIYMQPEKREAFFNASEAFRKKGVMITDYRIRTRECLPEKGTAEALAEFDYYILPSNRIKTLSYKQAWDYRAIGEKKSWKLNSGLPLFE